MTRSSSTAGSTAGSRPRGKGRTRTQRRARRTGCASRTATPGRRRHRRCTGSGRIGSDDWTCTTYDARGRVQTESYPAFGGQSARTVTHNYAVSGNPLVTSVSDSAGTITTIMDLLGRVTSYVDVWGNTTTSTYDI